jgi:hypothetical protein
MRVRLIILAREQHTGWVQKTLEAP